MKTEISIVIAVYNGAHFLRKCLPAVLAAADANTEILLVDDGSSDDSGEFAKQCGAKVLTLAQCTGSASARNIGVREASGEIIIFIDADVVVQPDTVRDIRRIFAGNPEISAIFGSYDDAPSEPDFFSQYRNLMHHFFHQTGSREAQTFWSGFGAIKRQAFTEAGGFDAEKFKIPSVEDIELGYRLRKKGHRILLVPELQAKHLKKWTFYSILRTDFWQRAVPWVEIMMLNPQIEHDLNVKSSQKVSAVLTIFLLFSLGIAVWQWWFLLIALVNCLGLIAINRKFYIFFWQRKGVWFTTRVFPMHLLYFFYSSAALIYTWFTVKILGQNIIVRHSKNSGKN